MTKLKLYSLDKLRSSIFCFLSVCASGIGNTRPNLHFFQYIQAYKPFADHVPPNTKHYQLILTKYQPVSLYTDPVPSSNTYNSSSRKAHFSQLNNPSFYDSFDESRTVYLVEFPGDLHIFFPMAHIASFPRKQVFTLLLPCSII